MDECIFCQIIARTEPARIVAENETIIVFLSLENHSLVAPKAHIRDLYALDDVTGAALMRAAIRMARALKAELGCEGVTLAQANEAAGGQDVFHLHLHLYPRWHDDGGGFLEPAIDASEDAQDASLARLRAALPSGL